MMYALRWRRGGRGGNNLEINFSTEDLCFHKPVVVGPKSKEAFHTIVWFSKISDGLVHNSSEIFA